MRIDLWLKYAFRNLRSGLKGFWIFLSCLTLGVAAIAMIGSLASAVQQGLDEQGQIILGGDVEFSIVQREAKPDELSYMKSKGELSSLSSMRIGLINRFYFHQCGRPIALRHSTHGRE